MSSPNFASIPRTETVRISAANPNRDGTGTITDLWVAPAAGSRIDKLSFMAINDTTAGMIRLFTKKGSVYRFYKEYQVTAQTPSDSALAFNMQLTGLAIILGNAVTLCVSTSKGETFDITAEGGDFT
jgi:hypothetical protein